MFQKFLFLDANFIKTFHQTWQLKEWSFPLTTDVQKKKRKAKASNIINHNASNVLKR